MSNVIKFEYILIYTKNVILLNTGSRWVIQARITLTSLNWTLNFFHMLARCIKFYFCQ